MDDDWITSPAARRILIHWTDPRPAWVWSPDGAVLVWRNRAAALFGAKLKKSGLRLAAEPVPIKGQIARLIRLGSSGRSSLARLQFLSGGRPASTTASVTPLEDRSGSPILLVVGVDPIDVEVLEQPVTVDTDVEHRLLPPGTQYVLLDSDGGVIGGSPDLADRDISFAGDQEQLVVDGVAHPVTRYTASPQGDQLVLVEIEPTGAGGADIEDIRDEEGLADLERLDAPLPASIEPPPHLDLSGTEAARAAVAPEEGSPSEPSPETSMPLSSLFDRLADSDVLYRGLPPPDRDAPVAGASDSAPAEVVDVGEYQSRLEGESEARAPADKVTAVPQDEKNGEPDVIAAVIEFDDDLVADASTVTYRVTGRGFLPASATEPGVEDDALSMDGESRRNFSEIGRILSDGVTEGTTPDVPAEIDPSIEPMPAPVVAPSRDRSLVSIGSETFILNRLPLGILVFRDQQVLFANRALTDLVGHPTIDSLREAGLSAIFPDDDPATAGPVKHLMRKDGARMPVTARLQSVSWQGRPALMLSAASADPTMAAEVTARSVAASIADLRNEGFLTLDATGRIETLSLRAADLIGQSPTTRRPLAELLETDAAGALREFLARPARFAETERPGLLLAFAGGTSIALFAEGRAGVASGYFGLVGKPMEVPEAVPAASEDPAMLARISRGVRRPLNTIIGFADLIRSAAFGTIENHRYLEYARDIRTAGQEIAVLVDELDDYARLNSGTFPVRPAELDLSSLLDSCVVRVRGQAGAARVLVRSAISEDLPHIRADRASLGQAVLNLLASAIDQTPANGSVILSAQREDGGGIVINVRDSGAASADPGERFVVFRDGVGKDGEALAPVRSSVGLALTRSLVAVNACTLTVTPAGATGTIFSLGVPADLVGPAAA